MWSSYIQLKLGHDFFKSYLRRLSDYNSDKCDCNNQSIQSPAHLLLDCSNYSIEYDEMKQELQIPVLSLSILLNTKKGIESLFKFLNKTKIARRKWLEA